MYSPMKSAAKKTHITIREEHNMMKNFVRDPTDSSESRSVGKSKGWLDEEVNAEDIARLSDSKKHISRLA